jgi:hypothetical protein
MNIINTVIKVSTTIERIPETYGFSVPKVCRGGFQNISIPESNPNASDIRCMVIVSGQIIKTNESTNCRVQ